MSTHAITLSVVVTGLRGRFVSPNSCPNGFNLLLPAVEIKLTRHLSVVIIHDKSASNRPAQTPLTPPSLQKLSFVGSILGMNPEDIRGDVLACQASSQEEIWSKLRAHPFAKVCNFELLTPSFIQAPSI